MSKNNSLDNSTEDIDLLKDVKVQLSFDPHGKEYMLFLKYFGDNNKYSYTLHDLDKETLKLIEDCIIGYYDTDQVYHSEYVGYDSYKTETDGDIDGSKEVNEFGMPIYDDGNKILIDRNKKTIISFSYESMMILSFEVVPRDLKDKLKKIQFDAFAKKAMSSVHILAHSQDRGMYLSNFKIDDKYINLDIDSNYNDDFLPVYNNLIENLNKDQVGLYLLHGSHGTGKTTLIRHLIRKINKRLIFVSPSMATQFSNPDMIPFLMMYPNSIIIIEDSENIIKKREHGNDQSVSNLLNLSDGILGDCLKFQIICTFNTDKSDIDDALLRKGRLIDSYEFDKLTTDKANQLLKKLGHEETDKPMRLSDIYNPGGNSFDDVPISIGFR